MDYCSVFEFGVLKVALPRNVERLDTKTGVRLVSASSSPVLISSTEKSIFRNLLEHSFPQL